MRITSSDMVLCTSYARMELSTRTERLEIRTTTPQRPQTTLPAPAPADTSEPVGRERHADPTDRKLRLLQLLVEKLTGRPIRILTMNDLRDGCSRPPSCDYTAGRTQAPPAAPGTAGWSLRYDLHETQLEEQQVRFTVTGIVRTADGGEIRISLDVSAAARSYTERTASLRMGDARLTDPIVVNFDGVAAELSDMSFTFDVDADGESETLPFLKPGAGFLVFDRNGNGQADDGRELFGPITGNGFSELATLDTDGNGWVDDADPEYHKLLVWTRNAAGTDVYRTLGQCGIGALFAGSAPARFSVKKPDGSPGGEVRAFGLYLARRDDGAVIPGSLQQIDLYT